MKSLLYHEIKLGVWFLLLISMSLAISEFIRLSAILMGQSPVIKAHLVAKGYSQEVRVDYFETFSLVVRLSTIEIAFSLALSKGWYIRQLDVQNIFLHDNLHETTYMHQPTCFLDQSKLDHVCLLSKALYGLKQLPQTWFYTLSTTLISYDFLASQCDSSLFIYRKDNMFIVLIVYVDILFSLTVISLFYLILSFIFSNS
jgi:Reverse transcriptase (RNA-dependent DNA polymerase)